MFITSESIRFPDILPEDTLPHGRRHHRGRNRLSEASLQWEGYAELQADSPHWDDLFSRSIRVGLSAAKQSLKPAVFVWTLMACVAALYYLVPSAKGFFLGLNTLQEKLGLLFPFLGMGLSVGLLAEGVRVFLSKEKRWTKTNTVNAVFNLMIFGILGVFQKFFYDLQSELFGTGTSISVLLPKVLVDQFIWTVFIANPYQSILYLWRNSGFSAKKVISRLFPFKVFWGTRVLPVLITNWAFWIPMVAIIYCFPAELQLPLAILAVTIWVLLLSILTSDDDAETT